MRTKKAEASGKEMLVRLNLKGKVQVGTENDLPRKARPTASDNVGRTVQVVAYVNDALPMRMLPVRERRFIRGRSLESLKMERHLLGKTCTYQFYVLAFFGKINARCDNRQKMHQSAAILDGCNLIHFRRYEHLFAIFCSSQLIARHLHQTIGQCTLRGIWPVFHIATHPIAIQLQVTDMLVQRNAIDIEESVHPAPDKTDAVDKAPGAPEPTAVTTSESKTVRYLHLGTQWVQGAMNIRKPDAIELQYVQMMMMWMLFNEHPQHIVQLGLGAAALTKFCYRQFPQAQVTAIELNPSVIAICESMFALPPNDARLNVVEMDAMDFVMDHGNHASVDILQVDLYDADARGPVLDSSEFYQACADCLTSDGMMTTNLFGDFLNYEKNLDAMKLVFDAVVWLPEVHDANIVVIAFKRAPEIEFSTLYQRASMIRRKMNLPAKSWVNGLKIWMQDK